MDDEDKLVVTTGITGAMLKPSRLFDGMDDTALDRLAKLSQLLTAAPGQVLIAEGQISAQMYLVLAGELEVVKSNKSGHNVRVALLGPSDWVGEMAILDIRPRSATVRVVAPSTLVLMSATDIERALHEVSIEQYAILLRNIGRELSTRLRVADGLIAQSAARLAEKYVKAKKAVK